MREIPVSRITEVVEALCMEANYELPEDIRRAVSHATQREDDARAASVLEKLIQNYRIAEKEQVPICQDTGIACIFMEIGQEVHLVGGDLSAAVNEGVRRSYSKGFLCKSVVADPIRRENTGDNTPAMQYVEIVPGEQIRITVAPKGFGSENMSAIRMLKPSAGLPGIREFIVKTAEEAGANPCPPMVIGVGIGGTFDKCAFLAKKALLRPVDVRNRGPVLRGT